MQRTIGNSLQTILIKHRSIIFSKHTTKHIMNLRIFIPHEVFLFRGNKIITKPPKNLRDRYIFPILD